MAHTAKVLTIAVAAYNVAPYIAQCLDSFVDEKLLPALDIVVIDDGSTDATARIVKKYINRFPESFRLVSQENGGYGAAVNHALALAQGEYFKTVDGDDWVDTKELLTVVCYLMDNRERSDVVVTDYCWVRHRDGKEIRRIKTDFAQFCNFLGRNIENLAETFQSFTDLLNCFVHNRIFYWLFYLLPASKPLITALVKPPCSMVLRPLMVQPPGVVTLSMAASGCSPVS